MSTIHFVSTDGATTSLQCYADDPDAESGQFITFVDLGDSWDTVAAKVAEHQAEHGCDEDGGPYYVEADITPPHPPLRADASGADL